MSPSTKGRLKRQWILALLLFPLLTYGQQRYAFNRGLFGTEFRLILYASSDSAAQLARRAVDREMDSLNVVMSDYLDGSEINRLSATAGSGQWVPVSPMLFGVLQQAMIVARKSGGLYDPTIGPLSQLWRRAVRRKIFPTKRDIRQTHRIVGYRHVDLDSASRSVRLRKRGMRLDVGGIGQGYAIDRGMQVLQELGIRSALLDMGGDILVSDPPPLPGPSGQEQGWRILTGSGPDTTTLLLQHAGITTSGREHHYLEQNGKRYSHLLNPRTGLGLLHHATTTVLAPDGTRADALTKVFSVAGIKRSKRLIRRYPGVAVWIVETKGGKTQSWKSPNWPPTKKP